MEPNLENELALKIADLDARLSALEFTDQPYIGDWIKLNPTDYAYSSATRITVSNMTASDVFNVGDKVRIKQTTYKYFYVYDVSSNYIDVTGGDDYSVANATIEEFAYSRASNPLGFPIVFEYSSTLSVPTGSTLTIAGQGSFDGRFFMIGDVCWAYGLRTGASLGGVADSTVREDLPLEADPEIQTIFVGYKVANGLSTGGADTRTIVTDTTHLQIEDLDYHDFNTGGFAADFNIHYKIAHN